LTIGLISAGGRIVAKDALLEVVVEITGAAGLLTGSTDLRLLAILTEFILPIQIL
jgi:hypothetical protein